ncbi:MAG: hypothetical protein JNK49_04125 [Planctomycetes bacterium]|nr:hypothetical protein [Planctomycetota bacterium]
MRLLPSLFVYLGCSVAVAQAPAGNATPTPAAGAPERAVHGRVERLGDLTLLRVWGTPAERGFAHGKLLATEIARVAVGEFVARFGSKPALLDMARKSVERLIEYPEEVQAELDGLFDGLQASGVDLQMPALKRSFDRTDLAVANALDVFGLMGCSGFTLWGDQVEGGGVLTARNFDWPLTGAHLLDGTMLLVEHRGAGKAVCAVTWPGYLGAVTGINRDGAAAFLHVGTGRISMTPRPGSWPTAIAARELLAVVDVGTPKTAWQQAEQLLGNTSPPAGFMTRVVLPGAPAGEAPAVVFETDVAKCVRAATPDGLCVTTNHFTTRDDGRPASKDSLERTALIKQRLGDCLAGESKVVKPADAWQALASVQRGNQRFGTLHALVFRHEPWCFELRVGEPGEKGCVPAPSSRRQYRLTREQVFGVGEPGAK